MAAALAGRSDEPGDQQIEQIGALHRGTLLVDAEQNGRA
jgi:hypothetical protein